MYTNSSNIIKTLIALLDLNALEINRIIREYEPKKQLTVYEGMRKTLPADSFPSLEIEPTGQSNEWATTRAQRPRYSFTCTLTILNSNENLSVEYINSVASRIVEIMTDPSNLQRRVENETKWDPLGGLTDTYIIDSLVEDVTNSATKDGTIRTVEFSWFALIHEPFPESKWQVGSATAPAILRPKVLSGL